MIIFRVAQGIACTSQTTVSDLTIIGMPGPLEHRSIIRFRAISGEYPDLSVTSQLRNQSSLDELHVDAESNRHGISYENPINSADITEKVKPNAD